MDGVHVAGLGRAGMALALLLADRGTRTLGLWDPRPVGPQDLGTGFLPPNLGRPRAAAAERRILELHPGVRVFAHHGPHAVLMGSATVSVTHGSPDVELLARALAAEHPVLPLVLGARECVLGPWTALDRPGCALCEEPPAGHDGGPDGAESVMGAVRAALHAADALVGTELEAVPGAGLRAVPCTGAGLGTGLGRPGSRLRFAPHSPGEAWEQVRPRPGCPCDPDAAWR